MGLQEKWLLDHLLEQPDTHGINVAGESPRLVDVAMPSAFSAAVLGVIALHKLAGDDIQSYQHLRCCEFRVCSEACPSMHAWPTCDLLSAADHTGSTPLHHAVRVTCGRGWTHKCGSECVQMVQALLKAGADTMRVDNKGRTALHYCCMVS